MLLFNQANCFNFFRLVERRDAVASLHAPHKTPTIAHPRASSKFSGWNHYEGYSREICERLYIRFFSGFATSRRRRISPHLPSSGFRRDGRESLPHRAGLTRAGMRVFSSIGGGEKMKRAIRLQRRDLPFLREAQTATAPSSVAIDLHRSGITEQFDKIR